MHSIGIRGLKLSIALGAGLAMLSPAVSADPSFTIKATNVTMPGRGLGSSKYTVTGIPIPGTMSVTCKYSGPKTDAKIPTCTYGPLVAIPVEAGETVKGEEFFFPYGSAIPLGLHRAPRRLDFAPLAGLALAGATMFGLGWRRRSRRWLTLIILGAGTLTAIAGISGCIGNWNGMTPGTYQYTIAATIEAPPVTPLEVETSTTISVTVP